MGRRKSDLICERGGRKGFRRSNPDAIVHYDHKTGKRPSCRIKYSTKDADHESAEIPPEQFWGESALYHKLGNMANHFHRIGRQFEKIQKTVYQFKPIEDVSAQCVEDLDLFDKQFLNPIEKLLIPYHDKRWVNNWTGWFKVQMDNFMHGPRAAGMINSVQSGLFPMFLSKDGKTITSIPIKRELTSSQVKKKEKQNFEFANELIQSHLLERALNCWSNKTIIVEPGMNPEEFYKMEMKKRSKKAN